MELTGQYTFAAPVEVVWNLLMDPKAIAGCLPGCQAFEAAGEDRYRVVLTAGVAAISGTFEGMVSIADRQPPDSYRLVVQGKGRPGFIIGDAAVRLASADDGVVVNVVGNVQVGGLIAQVGQRLLGAAGRMMMDRFFTCLQQKLAAAAAHDG